MELKKLVDEFYLQEGEKESCLYYKDLPQKILDKSNRNIYNHIFDFVANVIKIKTTKQGIHIYFTVSSASGRSFPKESFFILIGNTRYPLLQQSGKDYFEIYIAFDKFHIDSNTESIFLTYEDEHGYVFSYSIRVAKQKHFLGRRILQYSKLHRDKDGHVVYLYETEKGRLRISKRFPNKTDSRWEQLKIILAYGASIIHRKLNGDSDSVVLFEKFSEKYEESASVIFEKLCDKGRKNVFYILDANSPFNKEVPEKYKCQVVKKYSLRHYYLFFTARGFITTESMAHCIDLSVYNPLIAHRMHRNRYYFIFLQHGVMYMYSLKGRNTFVKGKGMGDNTYVVVSSEKEAQHFIDFGNFNRSDFIKSGLPKFDKSKHKENSDKIVVMFTTRNFEQSTIQDDVEQSTYYRAYRRVQDAIPMELQEKMVMVPHPLYLEYLKKSSLAKFIPSDFTYDELLEETRLLITDYSSIAYDAYYRGCHVLFDWTDKDMCLEKLGYDLMLNEENAFAEIAIGSQGLKEKIPLVYNGEEDKEKLEKYRQIVEFHDGQNTQRLIKTLERTNLFQDAGTTFDMASAEISGIVDGVKNNRKITQPNISVEIDGQKLVRNIDYSVKLDNDKENGIGTATIRGKGVFTGSKKVNYKILDSLENAELKVEKNQVVVTLQSQVLEEGKDYCLERISYEGLDVEKILVKGMGIYGDSISKIM